MRDDGALPQGKDALRLEPLLAPLLDELACACLLLLNLAFVENIAVALFVDPYLAGPRLQIDDVQTGIAAVFLARFRFGQLLFFLLARLLLFLLAFAEVLLQFRGRLGPGCLGGLSSLSSLVRLFRATNTRSRFRLGRSRRHGLAGCL